MVLDTSVVDAKHLREPGHERLFQRVQSAKVVLIGAPTLFESAMVLTSRAGAEARSVLEAADLSPNGSVRNTWKTSPKALGSAETVSVGSRRFIVDFAGGDLAFYQHDPKLVELSVSLSQGRVLRSFLTGNPHNSGFRALIDVQADPGQTIDMRAYLKAGARTLTETWTFPWTAE